MTPEITIRRGFGERPWVKVTLDGVVRIQGYVDEDAAADA